MTEILAEHQEYNQTRFYSGIVIGLDPEDYPLDDSWVEIFALHDSAKGPHRTLGECSDILLDAACEGKLDVLKDPEYIRLDCIKPGDRERLVLGLPVHVHEYDVETLSRDGGKYTLRQSVLCIPDGAEALAEGEIQQAKLAQADKIIAEAEARYDEIKADHDSNMAAVRPVYPGMLFGLFDEVNSLEDDTGAEVLASEPKVLRISEIQEPMVFGATLIHPSDDDSPYQNADGAKTNSSGVPIRSAMPLSSWGLGSVDGSEGCLLLKIRGKDFQGGTIAYENQPIILEINVQRWYSEPDQWKFIAAVAMGPNTDEVLYDTFYPIDADVAQAAIEDGRPVEISREAQGFRLLLPLDQAELGEINAAFPKVAIVS